MTERERLVARAMSCQLYHDYRQGVVECRELIRRFNGDVMGYNQLALFHEGLREFRQAAEAMEKAVSFLPNRPLFRVNLSLYAAGAGDWQKAIEEARKAIELGDSTFGEFALARAEFGRGESKTAAAIFNRLAALGPTWAWRSAIWLANIQLYQGMFRDAQNTLALATDNAAAPSGHAARVPPLLALTAYTHSLIGNRAEAITAAQRALEARTDVATQFNAASVLIDIGELDHPSAVADALAAGITDESATYGLILRARLADAQGDRRQAIRLLTDAKELIDMWECHFALGETYLHAKQYVQADAAFDLCIRRRGELLELNRYGQLPFVYFEQGRARQGLGTIGTLQSYRTYLRLRGEASDDPLVGEVQTPPGDDVNAPSSG